MKVEGKVGKSKFVFWGHFHKNRSQGRQAWSEKRCEWSSVDIVLRPSTVRYGESLAEKEEGKGCFSIKQWKKLSRGVISLS